MVIRIIPSTTLHTARMASAIPNSKQKTSLEFSDVFNSKLNGLKAKTRQANTPTAKPWYDGIKVANSKLAAHAKTETLPRELVDTLKQLGNNAQLRLLFEL